MKTTIEISDGLLSEAKSIANREGRTLRELVEEGLRQVVERKKAAPFKLKKGSFKGKGLHPAASGLSWGQLRELAYEGRGG